MEATSIVALLIILGLGYWFNSSREDKREQKDRDIANQKATKIAKAESSDMERVKNDTRKTIRSRALELGVDYTKDELDWICDRAISHSGKKGLEDIRQMFATAPRSKLEAFMVKIEKDHLMYLVERQEAQRSERAEHRWQVILDDFKKLNPAQQKTHLTYIKKNTDELTEEQLHILELISLSDREHSSSKDVMVGDVKLFSVKEK